MLHVKNLSGGYPGYHVLNDVSFSVERGELFGILGPNGSGKTTLLKMISGLLSPENGEVLLKNKSLHTYSPKELAKITAVLPQVSSEVFAYTVKETVSLGRYAHQRGWLHTRNSEDEEIVQEAMNMTGVAQFQGKLLHELSGGERQRVFLAQALAQEPQILLLDEPTNHLDLSYQKELLDQLKKWTRERGLTVVSIFHDLNLAGLYCDRILLLDEGEINTIGKPAAVLQESRIRDVYETEVVKQPHPLVAQPQMLISPAPLQSVEISKMSGSFFKKTETSIEYHSPVPLKTIATGVVTGGGMGWYQSFIASSEQVAERTDTISMELQGVACTSLVEGNEFSGFLVTTSNLTWIFINAFLADEAFIEIVSRVAAVRGHGSIVIGATQTGDPLDVREFAEKIILEMG